MPAAQQRAAARGAARSGRATRHATDRRPRDRQPATREGLRHLVDRVHPGLHTGHVRARSRSLPTTRRTSSGETRCWQLASPLRTAGSRCCRSTATDADASGDEGVWLDGSLVGFTTSGAYGHHVGQSLALAYVDTALVEAAAHGISASAHGRHRRRARSTPGPGRAALRPARGATAQLGTPAGCQLASLTDAPEPPTGGALDRSGERSQTPHRRSRSAPGPPFR